MDDVEHVDDLMMVIAVEKWQFTFSGLYPLRKEEKSKYFLWDLRIYILYAFSSLQVFTMLTELAHGVNQLSEVTDILYYFMTQAAYLWKLICFTFFRKKMFKIEDQLRNPIMYKYLDKYGLGYLKDGVRANNIFNIVFRLTVLVLVIFYSIFPIFDKDPEKFLPFAGWFPFDKRKYRTVIYITQISSLFVSGFTNSSLDIMTVYLITIGVAMLNMLKRCLRELDYKDEPDSDITSKDLNTLVEIHDHVIMYIDLVEDMFSYGIFIQFLASIGVICLTGFQMLVVPVKSAQFLMLISYISCMMCQVALYSWYGNEILIESESIITAGYMSNWYEGTNTSKKTLFLIMERAKREVKLTAGKFFTLSLATLLMILRSSYSYFAVLQRLYKD